jgi:hypothetical protein
VATDDTSVATTDRDDDYVATDDTSVAEDIRARDEAATREPVAADTRTTDRRDDDIA